MGKHADSLDLYEYCTKLDPEIIKQKVFSNKLFFNNSYALYSLEDYMSSIPFYFYSLFFYSLFSIPFFFIP